MMSAANRFSQVLVLSLAMCQHMYAQQDSVSVSSESTAGEEHDNYRYFSAKYFKQTGILKLANDAITNELGQEGIEGLQLSWEQKLTRSISAEAGWATPIANKHALFFNLRYYHKKSKKRTDSWKSLNNFNGSYFLLGGHRSISNEWRPEWVGYLNPILREKYVLSLLYGHQEKIGKWGFFDMAGGLNYFTTSRELQFSLNLKMGLAYGKFLKPDDDMSFLKYEDFKDDYALKKGILKWSNPYGRLGSDWGAGFNFSYEYNITNKLSLMPKVRLAMVHQEIDRSFLFYTRDLAKEFTHKSIALDLEARYYYNRARRLSAGQESKNFTGNYFYAEVENLVTLNQYNVEYYSNPDVEVKRHSWDLQPNIGIGWGTQQRIGKRGFFEVNLGVEYETRSRSFYPESTVSVGLLFGR